jgi:hypothetical protein
MSILLGQGSCSRGQNLGKMIDWIAGNRAAIDRQNHAGDLSRAVAGQVEGRLRDIVRAALAFERLPARSTGCTACLTRSATSGDMPGSE